MQEEKCQEDHTDEETRTDILTACHVAWCGNHRWHGGAGHDGAG